MVSLGIPFLSVSIAKLSELKRFDAIKQQNEFIETLIIAAPLRDAKAHVQGERKRSFRWQ